ncbi:fetuin-B [Xiphias gladius]|uniref:fetuin-B n=1 Tax=Xiphias gladius TaxID=8245 RepID=UPI001A97E882|nr:fetuin-B [Xiphias gladius]
MSVYLLVLCLALLPQEGRARPEPPGCSSPEAVRVAEEALEQINQDRRSGYILSLNRLYDVSHTPKKEKDGSLYNLTIDVMETRCHVISRKPWKQCEVKSIGSVPVYGECEVSAHVDTQVKLQNYSCVTRKVPSAEVVGVCPDCPTSVNLNEPIVTKTARLSLQKFNDQSHLANYFALENITAARAQWIFGMSYFVDFTIVETVCAKNTKASERGSCPPMDSQSAHRGYCSGSHVSRYFPFETAIPVGRDTFLSVQAKCEIYNPQAAAAEEQARAHAGHQHHNHTGPQPQEQEQVSSVAPGLPVSEPCGCLGTVVDLPASPRPAPAASSCPGPRRHNLHIRSLNL